MCDQPHNPDVPSLILNTRPHLSWPAHAALGFFPYPKLVMARACGPPRRASSVIVDRIQAANSRPVLYARLGGPRARVMTNFITRRSKIRTCCCRHRANIEIENVLVVLGAAVFLDRSACGAIPALYGRPGHVEGVRVLDPDRVLELLAAIDQLEALDHVQLLGVRRAVIVDKGARVDPDRVDDELVALPMPDRFPC